MRDINRIPRIMNTLKECWEATPDWRFGQLIENFKRHIELDDMFYLEDDVFESLLEQIFPKVYKEEVEAEVETSKGVNN